MASALRKAGARPLSKSPASKSPASKSRHARAEPQRSDPVRSPCGRYWLDGRAADAAAAFFPRYLRFTEGEWAGQPFVLQPWEEHDIVRPLFGWKRADGTRRYRRCYVWVPKKNGKTELAAGIGVLILVGDGEMGGQVYSIAADKDQAKLVFNKATSMVTLSPELSETLTCFKTSIWCPDLNAAFKPLSGTPEGKHGVNVSGLVGDEIHEWRDDRLYSFMHLSTAARRQPLEFLISHAGERSGYGWEIWQYCRKIVAGEVDDPETLVVIYAADPEDDWADPAVWAKANPNLDVSVKRSFLEAECAKARELPRLENDFKRFHLNLWTEQAVRWLPLHKWDPCGHPSAAAMARAAETKSAVVNERWRALPEAMTGRRATAGLDLSATQDLAGYCLQFPPEEPDGLTVLVPRFFVPEDTIAERVKRDKVPYDLWRDMGALTATPGNVVDYAYIKKQLYEDAERFQLGNIAIDRWNAIQLSVELQQEGLKPLLFGQGFASMSAPAKELERLVLACRIDHGGQPVLRWCVGNTAVETDAGGNIKPSKAKSREKIDGTVMTVMAIGAGMAATADGEESVFETLARARAAQADAEAAQAAGADSQAIDWRALNDVTHPQFAEMKRRFEALQERQQDDE